MTDKLLTWMFSQISQPASLLASLLLLLQGLQKVVAVSLVIGYKNKATEAVIAAIKKKKSEDSSGAEAKPSK